MCILLTVVLALVMSSKCQKIGGQPKCNINNNFCDWKVIGPPDFQWGLAVLKNIYTAGVRFGDSCVKQQTSLKSTTIKSNGLLCVSFSYKSDSYNSGGLVVYIKRTLKHTKSPKILLQLNALTPEKNHSYDAVFTTGTENYVLVFEETCRENSRGYFIIWDFKIYNCTRPFTMKLKANVFIEGKSASVTCESIGNTNPSQQLFKDSKPIGYNLTKRHFKATLSPDGEYECIATNKTGSKLNTQPASRHTLFCTVATFNIEKVKFSDSSVYFCNSTNNVTSKSASLNVAVNPSQARTKPVDQTVENGKSVVIPCSQRNFKNTEMSWLWNGIKIMNNDVSTNLFSNVETNIPGYGKYRKYDLIIKPVNINNSGVYTCQTPAFNVSAVLSVTGVPSSTQITALSQKDYVEDGKSITLNCSFYGGIPLPMYIWYKNREKISNSSQTLILPPSLPNKLGEFTYSLLNMSVSYKDHRALIECKIYKRKQNSLVAKSNFTLIVTWVPFVTEIKLLSKPEYFVEGKSIMLNCSSSGGNPPPMYIWLKKGKQIHNSSQTVIQTHLPPNKLEEFRYTILNINVSYKDHLALLQCGIYEKNRNTIVAKSNITLNVKYAPKFLHPNKHIQTAKNEKFSLLCDFHANPPGFVTSWLKDGDLYGRITTRNITIENVTPKHAGVYECHVKNDIGTNNRKIRVHVRRAELGTKSYGGVAAIVVPICLTLVAIVILIVIIYQRRKKQKLKTAD